MHAEDKKILVLNAGSSSIKLDIYISPAIKSHSVSLTGIGLPAGLFTIRRFEQENLTQEVETADYTEAVEFLMSWLESSNLTTQIEAIGHRIVHGGPRYSAPTLVTSDLIEYLTTYSIFDPEHTPAALALINFFLEIMPDVPQVACFDTAFFHDLPQSAQLISLPKKYREEGVRRYGFHGLSYTYLTDAFRQLAGEEAASNKVIYAHLGSGASLAALKNGKPVDTTMGFTPTSGIVMSTRSGDIDPNLGLYLHTAHGVTPEQFSHMTNFESGLLGVSGLSADMYTLLQNRTTNSDADDAINLFTYQVKKVIGAYAAALGGVNSLVFSGGMGEKSAPIRSQICEGLDFLGISLDNERNNQNATLISSDRSGVGVHVIPTDEAQIIHRQVIDTIKAGGQN